MKNILIINGHEKYPFAEGRLNKTLMDKMVELLKEKYNLKTTVVQNGYEVQEEIDKFKWADIVIFQHPIFWFGLPGKFKTYIDQVYQYGVFFAGGEKYGSGGLFTSKKYMLSTTWNAPETAFNNKDKDEFLEGKSLDEALFNIHKIHQFCGMTPIKSFSCHNVVVAPEIDKYLKELENHIKENF
ncbi:MULTISPECIES: NAD(P)H-dependent oxidoreductase [Cetobacterium]|jgi:modulator of drug activity B|uniref:NAD(P)H-dependent oxidoreductase n=1 Tax=Candidatus Cetobacterium colombiensis TaxID=3073100 RepID=A0ABU4WB82_9FUSO|nr:NAD(P)H-dependent oxidoreductase [Candidatus Cetobacterium colombiensis]MDX8336807.1 NAD(P)H-dependent oxidoreductase [Candidatus Cetobacterium colombiensis]